MHAVLLLFPPLPNAGIQNFGMWGMYDLVKAYRNMQKSIANHRVEDWEASNGRTKDTTRLFHGPRHDLVGKRIYAQPFRMWNRLRFHPLLQVSQIFQRSKSDANKQDFENKCNLTCQAQSTPKTIEILTKVFSTSGSSLVAPAWTGDELSHGQTWWRTDGLTDRGTSSKWGKFWLWSYIWPWRSRSITPESNRDLNQGLLHIRSKFGDPSLNGWWVIARTNLVTDWRTDRRTDRCRQRQYLETKTGLG